MTQRTFFSRAVLLAFLLLSPGAVLQAQELEWATSAGGVRDDAGLGIATDALGNSYVTGAFQETAIFGEGEVNETVLTEAGANDIFVAKYASDGTLLWATSAGGAGTDAGDSIATDALGNISVTGVFQDRATFGAGEANETVVSTQDPSFNGVFVARYAPDGTLLWATSARGIDTGFADGRGIATDALGNSYVTGAFWQMAIFGEGEVNQTVLTRASPFSGGLFVAKYAPDGNLLWATSAGGTDGGAAVSWGIATDPLGDSYVTGAFSGTAVFGEGEVNETVLTAPIEGIFVARYAPDGTLLWATSADGSRRSPEGRGIATDPSGNSYVTGAFAGTMTFGAGEAKETVLTAVGETEMVFVAKYAADGTLLWARSAGGAEHNEGAGIATDPSGSNYVIGYFEGTATFGAGETNQIVLTAAGVGEGEGSLFIAKYASDGTLLWATSARGSVSNFSAIATDGRGNSYVTGRFFGMATFGVGEANETVLTAKAEAPPPEGPPARNSDAFVAKYRDGAVEDDSDGDGVADAVDFCPGTVLPEAVPTRGRLLPNRFAITDAGPAFSTPARGAGKKVSFTIFETQGCSCEQIIDYLGLGQGHRKHGCSFGVMRSFIEELPEHGDGAVEDDSDGVADAVDFCPGTVLPEAVPTRGRLLPNHFAITDEGPAFSTHARGAGKKVGFTIFDTQGCSCEQIIDYLGLGQGHRKHGCSLGAMRRFINQLPE